MNNTGVDITAYLRATKQKLTRDPFNAALRLTEKGRLVTHTLVTNAHTILDALTQESIQGSDPTP